MWAKLFGSGDSNKDAAVAAAPKNGGKTAKPLTQEELKAQKDEADILKLEQQKHTVQREKTQMENRLAKIDADYDEKMLQAKEAKQQGNERKTKQILGEVVKIKKNREDLNNRVGALQITLDGLTATIDNKRMAMIMESQKQATRLAEQVNKQMEDLHGNIMNMKEHTQQTNRLFNQINNTGVNLDDDIEDLMDELNDEISRDKKKKYTQNTKIVQQTKAQQEIDSLMANL